MKNTFCPILNYQTGLAEVNFHPVSTDHRCHVLDTSLRVSLNFTVKRVINIWTHLIGFIVFVCITSYMLVRPVTVANPFPGDWHERLVLSCFFVGAILCLGVSWIFHTVYCHSGKDGPQDNFSKVSLPVFL